MDFCMTPVMLFLFNCDSNMKNPSIYFGALIESKMNEIILAINKTYSTLEADPLYSELRI
jgi:hypothetical protein